MIDHKRLTELKQEALQKALTELQEYVAQVQTALTYQRAKGDPAWPHLDLRRFLQVHVTNVIEASTGYDMAIAIHMSEQRS